MNETFSEEPANGLDNLETRLTYLTDALFFISGTNGGIPALVSGFGAVFTDVDQPDGSRSGRSSNQRASTLLEYFDAGGKSIFSSFVPASPGDGSLSFLGIVFPDARIARVRIITGNAIPGPDDDRSRDIVMMDDFIYGEPQALPQMGHELSHPR